MSALPANAVHPAGRDEWRAWLAENHARGEGVWLVYCKKGVAGPRVEYGDAVEEALCFGWIDSRAKGLDGGRSMLWFAPRKKRSNWAATNKARVERLHAAGLMTPAGQAAIDAAKADGSWEGAAVSGSPSLGRGGRTE